MRAIVCGYYGFGNAGDEAMLAGIIAGLRDAAGELDLAVLSGDPGLTARMHGVRALRRFDVRALRRELDRAQILLSGGGNLFQDATSARSCLYYLAVVEQALQAGVPVMVVGQGIGPLRRRWLRALVRRYLNRVQAIGLRDAESAQELKRMGVTAPPVRVAADLSLAMTLPTAHQVAQAYQRAGCADRERILAVAPRTWRVRGLHGGFSRWLGEALTSAARELRPAPQVVAFPMHRFRDDQACAEVARACGGIVFASEASPTLLAGMIGAARALVGMRLHALIFAAMGGAMPVAVSYDPKVDAFMRDIGMSVTARVGGLDAARLAAAIIEAWNTPAPGRDALRQMIAERRQSLREVWRWAVQIARK